MVKLSSSKGTTAELYFEENYQKSNFKNTTNTAEILALLDGRSDAMSTDNTEVLAWALGKQGFSKLVCKKR